VRLVFSLCKREVEPKNSKGPARYIYFYGNGNWSFVYFTFQSVFSLSRSGRAAIGAGCPLKKRGLKPTETSCISHSFNGKIADERLSPGDLKEDFIHSLQKFVEVDEPEPEAVPRLPGAQPQVSVSQVDDSEVAFDRMSEEDLLRGLDGLVPPAESDDDD